MGIEGGQADGHQLFRKFKLHLSDLGNLFIEAIDGLFNAI
jgi:hypothetical protein